MLHHPQGPRPAGAGPVDARCTPRGRPSPVRAGILEVAAAGCARRRAVHRINAATVAVLRGQLDEARWLAAEVHRVCTRRPVRAAGAGEYCARPRSARQRNPRRRAGGGAPLRERHGLPGTATATEHHASSGALLASHLPIDDDWLGELLQIPCVLVLRQHDRQPERPMPRFPPVSKRWWRRHRPRHLHDRRWRVRLRRLVPTSCAGAVHASRRDPHRTAFPADEFRRTSSTSHRAAGPPGSTGCSRRSSVTVTSDIGDRQRGDVRIRKPGPHRLRPAARAAARHDVARTGGLDRESGGARGGSASSYRCGKHAALRSST